MFNKSKIHKHRIGAPMRLGVFVVAALSLSSCSNLDNNSNWSRLFNYAQQAWSGPPAITLNQAAAIPYASIGVRLGDGPEAILVLASADGADDLWTSASHVTIETLNGRITRTDGIGQDLGGVVFRAGDPLTTGSETENTRLMDFRDTKRFGVPVQCQMIDRGPVTIEILGHSIVTQQKDERCHSDLTNWDFTNSFWVDSDGLVWKSVQSVHPDAPAITIETLRPPG
jgi:hypothetical protein